MIYSVVTAIRDTLNGYLQSFSDSSEDRLVLSNIIDQGGQKALQQDNLVYMMILGFEEEKVNNKAFSSKSSNAFSSGGGITYLNIDLLFTAVYNGKLYEEGVLQISNLMQFFLDNPVLYSSDMPDVNGSIDKISFELQNLSYREISNIWSAIGGKIMPYLVYKMRVLPLKPGTPGRTIPQVKGMERNTEQK